MSADKFPDDDTFLFADQDDEAEILNNDIKESWKVLIVDDEPEVHKVTELALDNLEILDKNLEFLHAYSGKEAIQILTNNRDIAVILLDVVMETDDAGLLVVKQLREELELKDVRIILRTGQPGYAPEEKVVIEYDINDYRTKTELTRNKLLTSVFSSIRTYSQIIQSNRSRDFLDSLNQLNNDLIVQTDFDKFAKKLIEQSKRLFGLSGDGVLVLDQPHDADKSNQHNGLWIANGTGRFECKKGERIEHSIDEHVISVCQDVYRIENNIIQQNDFAIYIKAQSCSSVLYFEKPNDVEISEELIRTFITSIASDLDNSFLLERVSTIAYQDVLTKLPNRTRFIQMLNDFANDKCDFDLVMLIDIDHFSDINDGLGQEVGNSLISSAAKRIEESVSENSIVSRIGADVFGVLCRNDEYGPEQVLQAFIKPVVADEHAIPINVTIGCCKKTASIQSGISVLKQTNIALNRAKKDLANRYYFYKPEMEDETSWRLGMIRRLTSDFENGKLQLWFQPQIRVKDNTIIGMEALLRWPDGDGGFISPAVFIPLAEYSGLIVQIGAWVIEQSCMQLKRLQELKHDGLRVAVNVSMPQFRNTQFVDSVLSAVESFDVPPEQLELEITESVVMDDPKLVISALNELKDKGFSIAIDDFGTGFSSLSYLQKLPLDRIKVDREFIKDIGEGGDGIIAETVIKLGQKLGLETIAEGIETQVQLEYIKALGCNESQGFLHAKPMPSKEFEAFLKEYPEGY